MNFENLLRVFFERPMYQRLFLAFTLGLFISCGARMAGAQAPGGAGSEVTREASDVYPATTPPNTGGR